MEIEKLKKGCGRNFQVSIKGNILEFECGRWRDLPGTSLCSKMIWCPLCAEKIIEELDNALAKVSESQRGKNDRIRPLS